MKKVLLLSASCLMLFSACKKDNNAGGTKPEVEAKKYDVTFNVDGFAQTVSEFNSANKQTLDIGDTLKNYAKHFSYRVYNSAGAQVNAIDQYDPDDARFGKITDQLPAGTYKVLFAAANGENLYLLPVDANYKNVQITSYMGGFWNDTFMKQLDLTVGSNTTQTVRLDRVVGAVEVNITDAIPADVSIIEITSKTENQWLTPAATAFDGGSPGFMRFINLDADGLGRTNRKFTVYVGNTFTSTSFAIRALGKNEQLLTEKVIENVRCYRNKKTTLSGALFSSQAGFTASVNPTWDTPPAKVQF
jgi:hypothetical protein